MTKKPDKNRIHKSHWYNMSTSTCCIDRFTIYWTKIKFCTNWI